jgi:hypothetical protein
MPLLPLSLLLFALTAAANAQAPRIDRIEIVEWGIFRHDREAEIAAPHTPTGSRNVVKNVRLQQTTTTIPALVGMKFGFRFRVIGSPRGARIDLKFVSRFPSRGLTNPAGGKTFSTSEFHSGAIVGETTYRGYSFDHDWEVEPGSWTLEVWHEGRKLAEKVFIVARLVSWGSDPAGLTPGVRFQPLTGFADPR